MYNVAARRYPQNYYEDPYTDYDSGTESLHDGNPQEQFGADWNAQINEEEYWD